MELGAVCPLARAGFVVKQYYRMRIRHIYPGLIEGVFDSGYDLIADPESFSLLRIYPKIDRKVD